MYRSFRISPVLVSIFLTSAWLLPTHVTLGEEQAVASPANADRLLQELRELVASGKVDEAYESLEPQLAQHPGWTGGLALKAEILIQQNKIKDAVKTADHGLSIDATHPELTAVWAMLTLYTGKSHTAMAKIEAVRKIHPYNPSLLKAKGMICDIIRQHDDSIGAYNLLTAPRQTKEDRKLGYIGLTRLYKKTGQLEDAEEALNAAISLDETHHLIISRMYVREERGNIDGALEDLAYLRENYLDKFPALKGQLDHEEKILLASKEAAKNPIKDLVEELRKNPADDKTISQITNAVVEIWEFGDDHPNAAIVQPPKLSYRKYSRADDPKGEKEKKERFMAAETQRVFLPKDVQAKRDKAEALYDQLKDQLWEMQADRRWKEFIETSDPVVELFPLYEVYLWRSKILVRSWRFDEALTEATLAAALEAMAFAEYQNSRNPLAFKQKKDHVQAREVGTLALRQKNKNAGGFDKLIFDAQGLEDTLKYDEAYQKYEAALKATNHSYLNWAYVRFMGQHRGTLVSRWASYGEQALERNDMARVEHLEKRIRDIGHQGEAPAYRFFAKIAYKKKDFKTVERELAGLVVFEPYAISYMTWHGSKHANKNNLVESWLHYNAGAVGLDKAQLTGEHAQCAEKRDEIFTRLGANGVSQIANALEALRKSRLSENRGIYEAGITRLMHHRGESTQLLAHRALARLKLRLYDKAVADAKKVAMDDERRRPWALGFIAHARYMEKSFQEALPAVNEALKVKQSDDLYRILAECHLHYGKTYQAMDAWNKAIAIGTKDPHVYLGRAKLLVQRGKLKEAVEDAKQADKFATEQNNKTYQILANKLIAETTQKIINQSGW